MNGGVAAGLLVFFSAFFRAKAQRHKGDGLCGFAPLREALPRSAARLTLALLPALFLACAGDGDTNSADGGPTDTATTADVGAGDTATGPDASPSSDVAPDATAGDTGQSDTAAVDSTSDIAVPDTGADVAADAGPCEDPSPRCYAPCVFDFRGADPLRPTVRVVRFWNDGPGVMPITDIRVSDASPLATFSPSWIRFMERATGDTWTPNEARTSFDPRSAPIEIAAGDFFEVEIEFDQLEGGGTLCPVSEEACGNVHVVNVRCDGTENVTTATIRR